MADHYTFQIDYMQCWSFSPFAIRRWAQTNASNDTYERPFDAQTGVATRMNFSLSGHGFCFRQRPWYFRYKSVEHEKKHPINPHHNRQKTPPRAHTHENPPILTNIEPLRALQMVRRPVRAHIAAARQLPRALVVIGAVQLPRQLLRPLAVELRVAAAQAAHLFAQPASGSFAQRLERIRIGDIQRQRTDGVFLRCAANIGAGALLPVALAERVTHFVQRARALVQDAQGCRECVINQAVQIRSVGGGAHLGLTGLIVFEAAHLMDVSVRVAIVAAHRRPAVRPPRSFQVFATGAHEFFAFAMIAQMDLCVIGLMCGEGRIITMSWSVPALFLRPTAHCVARNGTAQIVRLLF